MTSSSQVFVLILLALWCVGQDIRVHASEEAWERHWSFQKLAVDGESGKTVDDFIGERLKNENLTFSKRAERATLLRRLTLDLTGLPPTRDELHAFLEDESPDAYEELVERLLSSPHYGERWGRHWLDVARYVQGTIKVPGVDKIDLAEPYRDYVVRAFNEDKPFDRFVLEQLAGDLLPARDGDFDEKIAPSFLAIGPWFDECTDPNKLRLDIVDEQISTLTKAFLAMDFACSRCHDHKFDPIPTRDYYAMAGIFRSTEITSKFSEFWKDGRPRSVQALANKEEATENRDIKEAVSNLVVQRFQLLEKARGDLGLRSGSPIQRSVASFEAEDFNGLKDLKTESIEDLGEVVVTRRALDQWLKFRFPDLEKGKYRLAVRYASRTPAPVKLEINGTIAEKRILEQATFGETADHFVWGASGEIDLKDGTNFLRLKVDRHEPFPLIDKIELFKAGADLSPSSLAHHDREITVASAEALLPEEGKEKIAELDKRIADLQSRITSHPVALAVAEMPSPIDLPIHVGGNTYQTKDEKVPRGVPTFANELIGTTFEVPANESGRVELAEWITHPDNPLTARVIANRVWHWHFGTGLVRTTDDFGIQGAEPSHPELLDFLAKELIDSAWSIKYLHRLILLSQTYQQTSIASPESRALDADAAILSRFPRRRLEVEAIYDSMLTSIGKVPRQAGGTPLDTSKSKDRALYILTSSRSPIGMGIEIRKMFPLFGFDTSGRPIHYRDRSTTPNQALWWLNNPLPKYYADKLAEKIIGAEDDVNSRTVALVETVLGKTPDKTTTDAIRRYVEHGVKDQELSEKEAWSRAVLGLFSTESFSHLE